MINVGRKVLRNLYHGADAVNKVYRGDKLVWSIEIVPAGYTVLKSISSNGKQYIKTNIIYDPADKLYFDGSVDAEGNQVVLGTRTSGTYRDGVQMYINRNSSAGGTSSHIYVIGKSATSIGGYYDGGYVNVRERLIIDGLQMDGLAYGSQIRPIYIFCLNNMGNVAVMSSCTFYGFKLEGKCDLVPCLDGNNVPCLYDKISKTTYYNDGTGTFGYETLSGEIVAPI